MPLCFSAQVSYAAGAALLLLGWAAARRVPSRRFLPLALIPVMFGAQQLFEGALWDALVAANPVSRHWAAYGFLAFAYLVWPLWIPLSAMLAEPKPSPLLKVIALSGAVLGAALYLPLFMDEGRVLATTHGHSIRYFTWLEGRADLLPKIPLRVAYALIIVGPLLLSSHRTIRGFGLLITASVILAFAAYQVTFVSVWCFFAAWLSLYLVVTIPRLSEGSSETPERRLTPS